MISTVRRKFSLPEQDRKMILMSFPVVENPSGVITAEIFPEVFDFYPELNGRDSVSVCEIEQLFQIISKSEFYKDNRRKYAI
jgi:hemoglobin-like flavoprotein